MRAHELHNKWLTWNVKPGSAFFYEGQLQGPVSLWFYQAVMNEAIKSATWNPKLTLPIYAQSSKASRSEGRTPCSCASIKAKAKVGGKKLNTNNVRYLLFPSTSLFVYFTFTISLFCKQNLLFFYPNIPFHLAPLKKQAHDCVFPSEENDSGYIHICPRRRIPHTAFLAFSWNRRGPMAHLLLKILLQIPCFF